MGQGEILAMFAFNLPVHIEIFSTSLITVHTTMARKSGTAPKQQPQDTLQPNTLILDNGAHTIKAGFSPPAGSKEIPDPEKDCHIIANCIARSTRDKRTYTGSELLDECWDFGELAFRRPVERGFIVNWEGEKAIWERSFLGKTGSAKRASGLECEPADTNLILTEAPGSPAALQKNADEMVFEEFGFGSYFRTIGADFPSYIYVCFYLTTLSSHAQRLRDFSLSFSHESGPRHATRMPPRS